MTNLNTPAAGPAHQRFWRDRRGATAIEYGLIAALVTLAAMTAMFAFGESALAMYEFVVEQINEVLA